MDVDMSTLCNKLQMKSNLRGMDELSDELVGATHVENAGLDLFSYADKEDRSGNYHKSLTHLHLLNLYHFIVWCRNMVKAYFTSFYVFGIVKGLEELNEEVFSQMHIFEDCILLVYRSRPNRSMPCGELWRLTDV